MNEVKCPYCGQVRITPLNETFETFDVTGASPRISGPLKNQTVAKLYLLFDKARGKVKNFLNQFGILNKNSKIKIANSWIDLKCSKCGNFYRYNHVTEEVLR